MADVHSVSVPLAGDFRSSNYVRERFVGRKQALDAFEQRFVVPRTMNCVYYYGSGGLGKTWLLKRILLDNLAAARREVTPIIDFFDTQNHSKRGLQASIERRFDRLVEFSAYHQVLDRLDREAVRKEADPSLLSSLEKRADRVFVECCQKAGAGRDLILLFDTFERVQNLEAGRWFLAEFIPNVRAPVMAIAGRPAPAPAAMPDNVLPFALTGFSPEEVDRYIRKKFAYCDWGDVVIASIHQHTGGAPLVIDLLMDLEVQKRDEFVASLANLEYGVWVQDTAPYKCALVQRYQPPGNPENWPFWLMAFLKRRFDLPMLEFIASKAPEWFPKTNFDSLYERLSQHPIVKEYPALESHLLHDEAQRLLEECVLVDANEIWHYEIKDRLYHLIVDEYYPRLLEGTPDLTLKRQYRAEQIGYFLDRDPGVGLQHYRELVGMDNRDDDLEELLWGEVRDHLPGLPARGLDVCKERGVWLRNKGLYLKAGQHYLDMLQLYPDQKVYTSQSLGFVYMRQGRLQEAEKILEAARKELNPQEYEAIAYLENLRGQVARRLGNWEDALKHYAYSYRAASSLDLYSLMAGVLVNRVYLYTLQGQYAIAEKQSRSALDLLKDLHPDAANQNRRIYAWLNLGTVNRHQEKFDSAYQCYSECLELARRNSNLEAQVEALQHLGINQHLQGRILRRKGSHIHAGELARACRLQLEAWNYLTESMNLAFDAEWEGSTGDGLNRLGKVYREIFLLEQFPPSDLLDTPEVSIALDKLKSQANSFVLSFEIKYEPDLMVTGAFSELGWREKAARMFEVSALASEDVGDYHRALDSLVELARTLLWIRQFDLVPVVIQRIMHIKEYAYHQAVFDPIANLIQAELAIKQQQFEQALQIYQKDYIRLANATGYANYLLVDHLRDLGWRLREDLPPDLQMEWCDRLENHWLEAGLAATHPEMIGLLEQVRREFLGADEVN